MKRFLCVIFIGLVISACDLSSVDTPLLLCEPGQTENCTPRPGTDPDTGTDPDNGGTPGGTPTDPNNPNPGTPGNPVDPNNPNPPTPTPTVPTNPNPNPPDPNNPGTPPTPTDPNNPPTNPPTDPNNPGTPTDPNNPPTNPPTTPPTNPNPPRTCGMTARVRPMKGLSSETTFQTCYAPGDTSNVFLSYKLLDSSVVMTNPTLTFDMVRVNADRSVTSVAGDLLDGRPSANPNIFEGSISKDQLLAGLEAAVAFGFKTSAPVGKYVMVISLFRDSDAFNPANLVGRVFYDFEIK